MPEPPLKPLWSKVVAEPPPKAKVVSFDYFPRPEGITIVSPPVEVLKEGNEKFKFCIEGVFSKGSKPYSMVVGAARRAWERKGMLQVFQKDSRTYLFKFTSEAEMNKVLAQGTWYIEGQPMLLKAWGRKNKVVDSIPLWVKFSRIPDCYWTQKGLSWLASTIGRPLCADELTAKVEVLPFAKMCVEYNLGDDLPDKLQVQTLDPVTEELSVAEVLVEYPFKPLVCSGCRALGHKVGACPISKRTWVLKEKQQSLGEEQPKSNVVEEPHINFVGEPLGGGLVNEKVVSGVENLEKLVGLSDSTPVSKGAMEKVKGCNSVGSTKTNDSPPPMVTFKNLKNVDEIDIKRATVGSDVEMGEFKLSKSQKKKLRKQQKQGITPP